MSTPHRHQSSETETQVGIADEGGALSRLHPAFARGHMYTFRQYICFVMVPETRWCMYSLCGLWVCTHRCPQTVGFIFGRIASVRVQTEQQAEKKSPILKELPAFRVLMQSLERPSEGAEPCEEALAATHASRLTCHAKFRAARAGESYTPEAHWQVPLLAMYRSSHLQ
jgi:hypothetical protein